MKINWKVRFKNETFWTAFIPALGLVVTSILEAVGVQFDIAPIIASLLKIVKAVFALLTVIGVVVDPTTNGIGDSDRAMNYTEPWKDSLIDDLGGE